MGSHQVFSMQWQLQKEAGSARLSKGMSTVGQDPSAVGAMQQHQGARGKAGSEARSAGMMKKVTKAQDY